MKLEFEVIIDPRYKLPRALDTGDWVAARVLYVDAESGVLCVRGPVVYLPVNLNTDLLNSVVNGGCRRKFGVADVGGLTFDDSPVPWDQAEGM